jgi:hypothetical protein
MRITLKYRFLMLCAASASSVCSAATTPSISLSPGYTNVGVGGTVQYTATVTGLTNTAVKWEVNEIPGGNSTLGTITTGGLYKAPATVPSASTLIVALGSDGKTMGLVYVNVEAAGPAISSIAPNPVHTGSYTITVSGTGFKSGAIVNGGGVDLSTKFVNATTLTASGYQGPAQTVMFQVSNPGTLAGTAFGVAFTSSTPQTISPTTASVNLGATRQFTSAGATSWTATEGSISSTGLYTAPATAQPSNTVTITATGPNGSANATVTLVAAPQTISPVSASIQLGGTQQFTSAGATSWTATEGSISPAGLYTAPATAQPSSTVTIVATGPNGSASATVTLLAPVQTISPTSVSLPLGATQQFISAGATSWMAIYGTVTAAGLYTAPATSSTNTDTVSATGPNGTAQAAVVLVAPAPTITGVSNSGIFPLGLFSGTVSGSGFGATSVASLNGVALSTTYSGGSLNISGFAGQSGPETLTVSNGPSTSAPFTVQVGVPNALVSAAAARRFLEQAAFGPTPNDAAHVQTIGLQPWIAEQLGMAQISNYNIITGDQGGMPTHFLTNAVSNPDQLRQRAAFALSQIFVTSLDKLIWNANMVLYQNMLLSDAFGNYRQLMEDVTLSPAMGQYLDMANNAQAVPSTGAVANENYARELMQLFSLGTNLLNQDGTLQLDSNQLPIPTYSQFTVTEFARVYTGWTYAPAPGQPVQWGAYISSNGPLAPYPAEHDSGSKQLLNGYVSPAGSTPQQDLDNALDNIFNHPNVAPFVATQLIQHLVKSNPSPAYVSRVAAAFNNSGNNVRGDLKATITAVLLDPEARANDNGGNDLPGDGHLQEPGLFLAGMVRAFGGQMNDQNYYSSELANMGEDIFDPASVFNYYAPNYGVPGTTLLGGEFQIYSPNAAIVRANEVSSLFSQYSNPVQSYGPGTTVDLTPFLPLAANPTTLVNALDLTLTHGVMPAAMKSAITTAVTNDTRGTLHQVQTACYLILTSSYYNVWH